MSGGAAVAGMRAGPRTAIAGLVGIAAAVVSGLLVGWAYAPSIGWDLAGLLFLGATWATILPLDPAQTATHATAEDPTKDMTKLIVLAASVASLAAVAFLLIEVNSAQGTAARAGTAGLGLGTIAVSWFVVHTLFTLRYASLYYSPPEGGIDFNQTAAPRYSDFAYLGLTIGMTYQVSDTDLKTHDLRMSALRHALISYLFGALVLAASVNLISSLVSGGGK
jgi:uncharacterized membrane protein